ncbi:unnamed protein product [Calypogeia fissa]
MLTSPSALALHSATDRMIYPSFYNINCESLHNLPHVEFLWNRALLGNSWIVESGETFNNDVQPLQVQEPRVDGTINLSELTGFDLSTFVNTQTAHEFLSGVLPQSKQLLLEGPVEGIPPAQVHPTRIPPRDSRTENYDPVSLQLLPEGHVEDVLPLEDDQIGIPLGLIGKENKEPLG